VIQLTHSFTVPVTIDQAWELLLDIERVVPALPGASLDSFDGDAFVGTVRVKLGAIQLSYRGAGRFTERDPANHRVVMEATGRDARGGGTAAATITCALAEEGEQTRVEVATDLSVTGKPAQFGRGLMNDVGSKVFEQFAANLAAALQAEPVPAAAASAAAVPANAHRPLEALDTPAAPAEALDLMSLAGPAVAKRVALGAVAVAAVVVLLFVGLQLLA
jgi:carbon monoxide dehydrogenase subunit G